MKPTKQLINSSGNHTVKICFTQSYQVDSVARFIKDGLRNGEAIFVIAKPALRKILKLKMDTLSFDGQPLQDPDQISFSDAEFLLSCIRPDKDIKERTFQQIVVAPIINAQSEYNKVRVFDEMVDILWKQGQHDMAIQLKGYWKNLTNTRELSFLCTYSLGQADNDLIDQRMSETMLNVSAAACDRAINKLAGSQKISTAI